MSVRARHFLMLHAAVALFGVAGLFGKILLLSPLVIVQGRAGFAAVTLGAVLVIRAGGSWQVRRGELGKLILLGALLAVHWAAFFQAIQVSTVALGLVAFATFPVWVTVLEPYFFPQSRRTLDFVLVATVVAGLGLIVVSAPVAQPSVNGALGAFWGTLSGFTFALLALLNRRFVRTYSALVLAFYQNWAAALLLLPFTATALPGITGSQWVRLAVLGVGCTALAHSLFIRALLHVRAQVASLITCLEPVYGIALAWAILNEAPVASTLAGGALILAAAAVASWKH